MSVTYPRSGSGRLSNRYQQRSLTTQRTGLQKGYRVHYRPQRIVKAAGISNGASRRLTGFDLEQLQKAATISRTSDGLSAPHPNSGCIVINSDGHAVAETYCKAQGTETAEAQAVMSTNVEGCTAYLNLEPGNSESGSSSVRALVESGIDHVVIGMLHPLKHLRGKGYEELTKNNVEVSLLGIHASHASPDDVTHTQQMCLLANEALLHRAVTQRPLSVLKYAMTLDGKIAASTGHSAWVSSSLARQRVFALRSISDAVVVGGNTVRRDNPNLTTRREFGFAPTRIVMSRTLELPSEANLWNVSIAPTIVMTQRGARMHFQQELRDKGIEVVEFDFLSPDHVADYCYERGFLQLLWECGGTLSAPAIASGVIHKVVAFVSPKIIGGELAPSPCGDLGFVEMTQALQVTDMVMEQVGPDVMMTGYLPSSGGLTALSEAISHHSTAHKRVTSYSPCSLKLGDGNQTDGDIIRFYKAWDEWGVFSNFTLAPITMINGIGPHGRIPTPDDVDVTEWPSVEHYYQAQKFAGVDDPLSSDVQEMILQCDNADNAAMIGRRYQREHPSLLRQDWFDVRVEIMKEAVSVKFRNHEDLRQLLLSTEDASIVENAPGDCFWGCGEDGNGENQLGQLLMFVRDHLLNSSSALTRDPCHLILDA